MLVLGEVMPVFRLGEVCTKRQILEKKVLERLFCEESFPPALSGGAAAEAKRGWRHATGGHGWRGTKEQPATDFTSVMLRCFVFLRCSQPVFWGYSC
jgi:hypothetical protein